MERLFTSLNSIRDANTIAHLRFQLWRKNPFVSSTRDSNVLGKTYSENYWREKVLLNYWKPLVSPIFELPEKVIIMLHSRQHFIKGRLMVRSSPENEMGLRGIIQPASRIKN